MKTIISRLCCFIGLTAMMASCNLFIDDDELEANEFRNVPVHSGEGYDAPVKEHEGGCDIEYQFNEDVRVVAAETQDAYITSVKADEDNMSLIVSFRADTPKELLPKAGEIFLSTATNKFPMGANHRVLECEKEGDGYQCVMAFAKLEETFKTLHINGSVDFGTDSFQVASPPYEEEAGARTRAEGDDASVTADVKCEGNEISFSLPFSFSLNYLHPNGLHGEATASKEKNFYKVTNEFKFDDFSLDNMKADFVQTIEESAGIVISGGFTKSVRLTKNSLYILRNKPVLIGSVLVLVFWISADVYLDLDLSATITISKHKKYQNIYHLDLYEQKLTKETKVLIDKEWHLDASIDGSFGLRVELTIGIGIYGKVLSVRFIPTLRAMFTLTTPIVSHESGQLWFDLSNAAGLTFTIDFSVKLGVFLDLSLKTLFGDSSKPMKNKELIDKVKKGDPEAKKKFDELANQASNNDHIDEKGAYLNLGPWILFTKTFTWYPKLDDKSFQIIRSWDKDNKQMTFSAQYKLSKWGFWTSIMGRHFTPGLMIKRGKKYITTIFPNEGGTEATCSLDKTYTFDIPIDYDEKDIMYTAYPCFFELPWKSNMPDAFDKGLPFCNTSPEIVINEVVPYDLHKEWLSENGELVFVEDDFYDYAYTFDIKTLTAIKGAANIDSWQINELYTGTKHKYSSKKDKKKDGIYIMYWDFTVYRKNDKKFPMYLSFYPIFSLKDSNSSWTTGRKYDMTIWSNRTYEVTQDSYGGSFTDTFSRMRDANPDSDDEKSVTKCQLNAIECDGEIIWQRPGSNFQKPEPSTTPFQKL